MIFGPNPLAQPIGLAAISTIAGLLTEPWQPESPLFMFLCIGQAILIGWLFRKKPSTMQVFFRDIFLWVALALLAGQWARINQPMETPEINGSIVTIRGTVIRVDRQPGKGATVDFHLKELLTGSVWKEIQAGIRLRADSSNANWWFEGIGYEMTLPLTTPDRASNFNDFDYRAYLNANHIWFTSFASSIQSVRRNRWMDEPFRLITGSIRLWVEKTIATHIPTADGQGFARGLLLGSRSWIDKDWLQAYSQTGTLHILSVSGLHAGMVAMIFYFPLIRLRSSFPKWGELIRVLLTISGLIFYGNLTAWPVSMTRALLMAAALLSTTLINRHKDSWSPWFLAMTIVLWVNPNQLTEPGFLLSFLAVSMVISAGKWLTTIPGSGKLASTGKNLTITVFALIGTAPVTLAFFKNLPLAGSVANLIVIPLTGFILVCSLLTLLTSPIASLAGLFGNAVSVLSTFSAFIVETAVQIPHSFTRLDISDGLWPLLFAILAGGIIVSVWFNSRLPAYLSILFFGISAGWLINTDQKLKISVLDAGQGDCLIANNSNHLVVLDGGPKKNGNKPVSSSIESAVYARGFQSISYLIISHAHADHYAGLLNARIPVDTLFIGDTTGSGTMFTTWVKGLKSRGTTIISVENTRKVSLGEKTAVYLVNLGLLDKNPNNKSLFVRFQDGANSFIAFGDAETELENRTLAAIPHEFLKADALKVSHHGSKTSTSVSFLHAVSPRLAIISCAAVNSYGHPDKGTIGHLHDFGITVRQTPATGEIQIHSEGIGWNVKSFNAGEEQLLLSGSSDKAHPTVQLHVRNSLLSREK